MFSSGISLFQGRMGLFVLAAVAAPTALAQESVELGEVVVTATRSERDIVEAPVRTEVVSAKEIERTHARSLKEALENVPGLQLREVHGKSGYELSLQGLSSDQVLVLIDGLPLAASTGSTVDLSQYALADVARIEVVKGAASAQYGSSAMGGVINVITNTLQPGLSGKVTLDAGGYGEQNSSGQQADIASRHGRVSVGGGSERVRFRLAADVRDDDGFSVDPNAWARQGDVSTREQYAARVSVLPAKGSEIWLETDHYLERDGQRLPLEYFPPNIIYPQKNEDISRARYVMGAKTEVAKGWLLQLNGLDESYESDSSKFNNLSTSNYDKRSAEQSTRHVSAQLDFPLWSSQLWQIGVDRHEEHLKQSLNGVSEFTGNGGVTRTSDEVYVQSDIFLRDNLEVVFGARYQEDSDFGGHAAPKISLRWTYIDDGERSGVFRLSAGQGYRVPNLKERYYLFDHSTIGYKVQGNPNLQPESSDSYQLGTFLSMSDDITIDANIFYNDVKDLIQTDESNFTTVNGIAIYTYENIANAVTFGAETSVRWKALDALSTTFSYTYTHTEDVNTGEELTRRPMHMARVGLDWSLSEKTMTSIRARYQSDVLSVTSSNARSPEWAAVDTSVNHKIINNVTAFVGVNNLFGEQRNFNDSADFGPIVGRYVYLGASWAFGSSSH